MLRRSVPVLLVAFCLVFLVAAGKTAAADQERTEPEIAPGLEPEAAEPLRNMLAFLEKQTDLNVRARVTFDVLQESGQLLQFSETRLVSLRRPDRLRAWITRDDGSERNIFFDGETLTIADGAGDGRHFTRVTSPPEIDAMLDFAEQQYAINVPFSEFVKSDAADRIFSGLSDGMHVGDHKVGAQSADHLAFRQQEVDWQIWISKSEPRLPLKLVITYREESATPQFIVQFEDWDFSRSTAEREFVFKPDDDDVQVPALPLPRPGWQ